LYASQVGSDYVEEGRRAARWLLENTKDKPGDIHILELRGALGSAPANDRKRGFSEIIAPYPRYKVIRSESGDFVREKGKDLMAALLKEERRRIDVLFAHTDDMALSAIEALEEAGIQPGKDITVISIGGVKEAFEAMVAGKINVIVECNPLLGPQLIAAAREVAAGKSIPKRIVIPESVFSQEVAAQELPKRQY
jgi:simple sugar transport system substrate-binding protein